MVRRIKHVAWWRALTVMLVTALVGVAGMGPALAAQSEPVGRSAGFTNSESEPPKIVGIDAAIDAGHSPATTTDVGLQDGASQEPNLSSKPDAKVDSLISPSAGDTDDTGPGVIIIGPDGQGLAPQLFEGPELELLGDDPDPEGSDPFDGIDLDQLLEIIPLDVLLKLLDLVCTVADVYGFDELEPVDVSHTVAFEGFDGVIDLTVSITEDGLEISWAYYSDPSESEGSEQGLIVGLLGDMLVNILTEIPWDEICGFDLGGSVVTLASAEPEESIPVEPAVLDTTVQASAGGELPRTGIELLSLLLSGVALLLVGTTLLAASRRRQATTSVDHRS